MGLTSALFAGSRPIDESPLGQSRRVAGGSEGRLRYPSFLSSGDLVLRQEQPAAKSLLAHLSQPKAIEKMAAASGGHDLPAFDNLTTLKTSADEGRRMVHSTRSRHPRSQCRSIPRAS
jgi:hypothetical protein